MIVGIGLDITDIEKIAKSIESNAFQNKVFTVGELEACGKLKKQAECLAGKFAVKEACMKASGKGIRQGIWFTQIEVLNDKNGAAYIRTNGQLAAYLQAIGVTKIHVSVTHSGNTAAAVVILEKPDAAS